MNINSSSGRIHAEWFTKRPELNNLFVCLFVCFGGGLKNIAPLAPRDLKVI